MSYSIAIVGSTGLVGSTLISLLEEKNFPIKELFLVASNHSAGKEISFKGKKLTINNLSDFDFSLSQLAFFCVGNELASQYVPKAVQAGNIVIDKSNFYRNHAEIPLVVPEVNLSILKHIERLQIIANPNCNTIPIAVGLKPIYDAVGIERINVATYQSVSGTGKDAVAELSLQTQQLLSNKPIVPKVYPQQIAFNVLPHCDDIQDNGYTREEMKIVWEMRKIFNDKTLAINPTAVRVPVFCGHAAAVHIETKNKLSIADVTHLLSQAPGIQLIMGNLPYPTPVQDAVGKDPVFIGRIREDISHPRGINLWIVADNLRKGAALNALQIAEYLIKHHSFL